MENSQIENAKNILANLQDCMTQINLSHESINFEYERNIRRNNSLLDMNCFSKEDKWFFAEQNKQIQNYREREEQDYEEFTKTINNRKQQIEEEIEKAEKERAISENSEDAKEEDKTNEKQSSETDEELSEEQK